MAQSRWMDLVRVLSFLGMYYILLQDAVHVLASSEVAARLPAGEIMDPRSLAGLAEKWNLTENGVIFEGMEFRLDYIVSDFILDTMIEATAYTAPDCKDGGVQIPPDDMTYSVFYDSTLPGTGDFERDIWVEVRVNPNNTDSLVYKDVYNEQGQKFAEVEFCIRMGLYTSTATPIEVNYLESIVGFKANLTSGFQIDNIAVAPKEKIVNTAVQEYEVQAYLCDEANEILTGPSLTDARTQGEIIRVCVTPNEFAREQGVYMRAIEEYTWFRDYGGPLGLVTQFAVVDSQEADNFLTVLNCAPGSVVCSLESLLFANMYITQGEVAGSGTALLQIGNDSGGVAQRRGLEGSFTDRELQEAREVPPSQFDIEFEIRMGEEFQGIIKTGSSPTSSLIVSALAIGTITVLNLIVS